MRWLTNTPRDDADKVVDQLSRGWAGREIVVGDPSPTSAVTVDELKHRGMVGLYELRAGVAVS